MNDILAETQIGQSKRFMRFIWLGLLILLIGAVVVLSTRSFKRIASEQDQAAMAAAIEEQYGIRVVRISTTADKALLDFRFQIVDPEKATDYMHGPYNQLPVLVVEKTGTRLDPPSHTHHANYEFGRVFYQFYRNPKGSVIAGTEVSVILGDLYLKHLIVQ